MRRSCPAQQPGRLFSPPCAEDRLTGENECCDHSSRRPSLSLLSPQFGRLPAGFMGPFAIYPSSVRTGTPKRAGSQRTRPFPIPPASSSFPITMSSACFTARASPWKTWALGRRRWMTMRRAGYGCASPSPITFSAARPRACGSTLLSRSCLVSKERLCGCECRRILRHHQRQAGFSSLPARALYDQFNIEVLATTNSPLDPLTYHQAIRDSGWKARILPTFRPDSVVDPEFDGFRQNVERLGEMHGEDCSRWPGYLLALRHARERFQKLGCTATDHGHPTARTADLDQGASCGALRSRHRGQGRRDRTRALPRSDADRNGAHERGGRAGDADSSRQPPQSQSPGLYPLRP